ncbi:hypothetical protein [Cohnella sp. GCM10027633]|uniref:hypothetical protein n=1 Tax=unclassified Cohnella TaxID=2636738 RepID=UPI00362B34B3
MKKKNSSTLALSAALLALMLMTAACSDNDNGSNGTPSATPSVSASASPDAEASPSAPASSDASANPSEAQEAVGEYVGLIDSHSIEIKLEDSTVAFQVSPEIADKLDPWESDTPVKFTYTENTVDVNGEKVTQYTIESIDKQ